MFWPFEASLGSHPDLKGKSLRTLIYMLLEAVRHFRSVVIDAGSCVTTAHAQQCCMGYAKTVLSRMKLTMKLTIREPASMTTDT